MHLSLVVNSCLLALNSAACGMNHHGFHRFHPPMYKPATRCSFAHTVHMQRRMDLRHVFGLWVWMDFCSCYGVPPFHNNPSSFRIPHKETIIPESVRRLGVGTQRWWNVCGGSNPTIPRIPAEKTGALAQPEDRIKKCRSGIERGWSVGISCWQPNNIGFHWIIILNSVWTIPLIYSTNGFMLHNGLRHDISVSHTWDVL